MLCKTAEHGILLIDMKSAFLLLLTSFYLSHCLAQRELLAQREPLTQREPLAPREPLYALESKIRQGDENALRELASYLDSSRVILDPLGYHQTKYAERSIALRMLRENTLFLSSEISFDKTLTRAAFINFLDTHQPRIIFDDTSEEFLITRLGERNTLYELRTIKPERIKFLDSIRPGWTYPYLGLTSLIDELIARKDPRALLHIATGWYYTRARYNEYMFKDEEFLGLMQVLTHEEIAVPDKDNNLSYIYNYTVDGIEKLNQLIYWVNHYNDYQWDDEKGYFVNRKQTARAPTEAEQLFQSLGSPDSTTAINGFTRLTEMEPEQISRLSENYKRNNVDFNRLLPTFTYSFLQQMTFLAKYGRENHIRYKTAADMGNRLEKLLGDALSFPQRYQYEEDLIDHLSLDEITEVEYFGLLHENDWNSTYSIGRIIDKFYSKNWQTLIHDRQALQLYLKKSILYDSLGIIGNCNKYLRKFENCSAATLQTVKDLQNTSTDKDISLQAGRIIQLYSAPKPIVLKAKKTWEGNDDYKVGNLERTFNNILRSNKDQDNEQWAISQTIGKISYKQIGALLHILEKDSVLKKNSYDFLERDFGFYIDEDDTTGRRQFIKDYETLTEYQLYEKYLEKTNPAYACKRDSFDYQKIYNILKYDIVDAFVGGGGSRREDGVYLLIKLLELKFHTTLGFPKKRCNSQGLYGCDCTDRAKYWMQYLEKKGLVKVDRDQPVSISYND